MIDHTDSLYIEKLEAKVAALTEALADAEARLSMLSHRADWKHPDDYAALKEALRKIASVRFDESLPFEEASDKARREMENIADDALAAAESSRSGCRCVYPDKCFCSQVESSRQVDFEWKKP